VRGWGIKGSKSPRNRRIVADFEVFSCVSRATLIRFIKCIVSRCSGSVVRTVPAATISAVERMLWSRLSRDAGVAVVALFAGFLLSPRIAEAGCGDYVSIHGGHVAIAHSMPNQPVNGGAADGADHNKPHRPCQGPGCRDGSIPPQAPTPGTTYSIDRWALAPGDALPNPVSCSNELVEPRRVVTDGFHLSILRPPR
jgi:hypothetical protein